MQDNYYLNIARENWLRGTNRMGLMDKLYVFVRFGDIEKNASQHIAIKEGFEMEPVKKVKVGAIEIAVWENTSKEGNKFFTTTMERNYKDGDEWKKTGSLRDSDIPKAILALQKAFEFVAIKSD